MPYLEEEGLACENLVLVTKNYAAHGFRWVILTDLQPLYVAQVGESFAGYDHRIFTLRQEDDDVVESILADINIPRHARGRMSQSWRSAPGPQ